MVGYESDELFPFPRAQVWKLLEQHSDDAVISRIHPLINEQHTVSRADGSVVVERKIDARGKLLTSQWRLTPRPPDTFRWDILSSEGPYAPGSWMENTYTEEGSGTRIRSRAELKVTVVPFFIPQRAVIRRVLDTIDDEDQRFLRG
jgi:hypothetical protein